MNVAFILDNSSSNIVHDVEDEQKKLQDGKPFELIEAPGETGLKCGEEH